ncbi:MAG TPA: hypothetical protein DF774_00790 [Rheinheimera sp.]|uniref:hypothetical protein n=1 Tax=Rheinheimera sp. TaxID=1869214 RepID=UPI000ED9BAEE|nr:hypothetical protein [Rheinheimera sp.]HCU64275.1 hypothetical protein [Rheinheimera sp.]
MRRELAFVIAEVLSLLPGALISAFGDGRAQYGYALLLVGLPFYCLGVTLFLLPIFSFIERRKSPSRATYVTTALLIAAFIFALVWFAEVGIVGSLAIAVSVSTAFILTAWFMVALKRA